MTEPETQDETQYEFARRMLRPLMLGAAVVVGIMTAFHLAGAVGGDGDWPDVARGVAAAVLFLVAWRRAPRNSPDIASADLVVPLVCVVLGFAVLAS